MRDKSNADGFALSLRLRPYKNVQGFFVSNSHLTGMIFCPYNYMEKVFLAHVISFILTKVGKRTVTNFDIVTVEQFIEFMCFWEMFTDNFYRYLLKH